VSVVLGPGEVSVEQAWAASFLARLPVRAQEQLRASAHEEEVFAGQNLYRELREPRFSVLIMVVNGLLRAYVTSPQGRQMVTRYWRPGELVGMTSVMRHGAPSGVDVVRQGTILRLDPLTFERLGRSDAQVAWTIAEELADRLIIGAEVRLPNAFGSVRVRLAWHLLELACEVDGEQVARVTQQDLADSIGSVREVVARALLTMSQDGLIARKGPAVVITDPDRMRLLAQSFTE